MIRRVLLLAVVFLLVALATSRVALVGHELVGHGLLAVVLGADLVSYKLFLFGGGWVTYRWTEGPPGEAARLAVALGGIGLEVVAGAIVLVVGRRSRGPVARVGLMATATVLLLHAGYYLAAGTHHGFGDGLAVHNALGAWRTLLVVPVSLAVIVGGFFLARALVREVASWVEGGAIARTLQILLAAMLAALGHLQLTLTERALTRDDTYARIMEHENVRLVARDMRRFATEARLVQGRPPTPEEIAAARARFEAQRRPFPLAVVLAVALALSCLLGLWFAARRASAETREARWRSALWPAIACASAITLVALLELAAPS